MDTYYIDKLSAGLFWDIDLEDLSGMDKYPSFIIQRVLEFGVLNDWKIILDYYG